MNPSDKNELTEQELDALLPAWQAPTAPSHLRSAIFPEPEPWWQRLWNTSIRIPLPLAGVILLLLVLALWRSQRPQTRELQPVTELQVRIIRSANVQN